MQPAPSAPSIPVGSYRSFDPFGPKYRVRAPLRPVGDDWLVEIELIETGETTEYRLSRIENDPIAE